MDNTVDPQDIMASQDFQKDAFAPVSHEYDLALYQAEPTFSLSDLSFDGSHSAHDDTCCFDMPTANFGGYRRSAHDDLCLMTQPNLQSLHSHHVSHRGAPLPPSLRPHHPMSHYNCPQGSLYSSAVSMPVESFASVTALMDHDESSSGQNTGYHDADMGPSAGGNGVPESVADDLKSYTSLCDSDCMDSCGSECGPGEVCREDNCTNERSSWSLYDTSHDDMEAAFALTNVGSEGFLSTYVPARSIGRIVPHLIQMASPSRTSHANYKASLPTCKPTSLPGSRTPTVMSPFIFEHSVDCVHEKPHAPTKDSGPLDGTSETATSYTCLWCTNHPGGQQTCCNQAFPSEDALHTHWEEEHKPTTKKDGRLVGGSEQVGFWCDWKGCSRTEPFGQRTKLDRHVTCHTGCESLFSNGSMTC